MDSRSNIEDLKPDFGNIELAVGQSVCRANGIEFFKYPNTPGLLSQDGRKLMHNGVEIDNILKIGKKITGERYAICEKVNGKPLIVSLNGESDISLQSSSLDITHPLTQRWLGIHNGKNIFYRESQGLTDSQGNLVLLNGRHVQELVYREGDAVLMELDNGDESWIKIQNSVELASGKTQIGYPQLKKTNIDILRRSQNSLGRILGKEIYFLEGVGLVTSENQEILINGEVVGEVAYYDSKQNALVVELMSGKEVCILLDTPKSHIQQIETRAQIENLTTVAA